MTEFTQDKIFKNVNNEDAKILVEIMGKKSDNVKIWTKELRLLDPKDYRPDILLELDDENLILELQSRYVDDDFSARGLTFVAIANRDKENTKQVNLMVLSSVEKTKKIKYSYNNQNDFIYDVISLQDLDSEEIINNVEPKITSKETIEGRDLVLYALLPLIDAKNLTENLHRVTGNLLKLKGQSVSLMDLSMGIEWLLVDKYVTDEEQRNILCDALGDKMTLIYEYGNRKEKNGIKIGRHAGRIHGRREGKIIGRREGRREGRKEGRKDVIENLLKFGMTPEEISSKTDMPLDEILEIAEEL